MSENNAKRGEVRERPAFLIDAELLRVADDVKKILESQEMEEQNAIRRSRQTEK